MKQEHITLRVYQEMLQAICNTNNIITCEDLLSAPLFDLKYYIVPRSDKLSENDFEE
jgi:hypothetical protein